jgi:hypothetical protein
LSCLLCTLCCQFLWIFLFWLPLRYSLTFICPLSCVPLCCQFLWIFLFDCPFGILSRDTANIRYTRQSRDTANIGYTRQSRDTANMRYIVLCISCWQYLWIVLCTLCWQYLWIFLCIIPPGWTVNERKKLQSSKYGHGKCFIENMIFHKLHCISWITILFERSHMFPFCFDFLIYQLAKVFQHSIKWHCSWQFYINHDPSLLYHNSILEEPLKMCIIHQGVLYITNYVIQLSPLL